MNLDVSELTSKMFEAFKGELSSKWPEVKDYAEVESKKLAENFAAIEKMKMTGKTTKEKAKFHHEIQRNTARTVLLTVEGLSFLVVEQAINAAMDVVKDTINGALDFALL